MSRKANPYSRVTDVLGFLNSAWKEYWWRDVGFEEADRFGDECAAFGTGVHKIVEWYLLGKKEPLGYSERQKQCAGYIIEWIRQVGAKVVYIQGKPSLEFEMVDDELKLTGHLDALFDVAGVYWLADFKTSSKFKREFPLQKAAYAKMLEKYGIDVNNGVTIRVDRDPAAKNQFELKEYTQLKEKYWPVFHSGLEFYQYMTGKVKI